MSRGVVYDRAKLLRAAAKAQEKKQRRRAIALYRQVLTMESGNAELHAKLAPLLAKSRQRFDALLSFREAASCYMREGKTAEAIGVYREATTLLPREPELWVSLARLLKQHRTPREAIDTLLAGRKQLRSRRNRAEAIWLLRQAGEIEAWDLEVVLGLVSLLAKSRQREEAMALLAGLRQRIRGTGQRPVCKLRFQLSPTPANLWRWLRAAMVREPKRAPARARG
jgi:tetratricopeptide (TPR) repeat protein